MFSKAKELTSRSGETGYRSPFEHICAGIVVHAPDSRILYHNQFAAKLLGRSSQEMLSQSVMHPDWCFIDRAGRPLGPDNYPVVQVLATREAVVDYVLGVDPPHGGTRVWLQVNAIPELDEGGGFFKSS